MTSDSFELNSFFKSIESHFKDKSIHPIDDSAVNSIHPNTGECFFLFDLTKNLIVHITGMEEMFGYQIEKIDTSFIFNMLHPEDSPIVQAIIQNCVGQMVDLEIPRYSNVFKITSRQRKNDGSFISVLSENFVFQVNDQNLVQSILVRYTDVSFLDYLGVVEWWVDTKFLDASSVSNSIYGENKDIFTEREKQVILEMFSGKKNSDIALVLNISQHTVSTHRRNILSKSDCSSVEELRIYCKKNGVFLTE